MRTEKLTRPSSDTDLQYCVATAMTAVVQASQKPLPGRPRTLVRDASCRSRLVLREREYRDGVVGGPPQRMDRESGEQDLGLDIARLAFAWRPAQTNSCTGGMR